MIQKKMEAGADEEGDWPAPEAPKAPTSNNTQAASSFFAFTMSAGSSNGTVPPRLLRWTNEQLVGAMATAATATHPAALAAAASHAGGLLDLFLS
eukprot:CAMPEP_0175325688 /NCGR_PEP_ID=MMETSP0093-20121207/74141_1 /TAXON_ID=311494 /ORGANISM="Alexandrium monilatum, Strain CCMP3105" /LENGTH=94 /DNA_ID=CAMNT_0016622659 /DNA_START=194 /DNA_END=478 /DNA_ORIENTATION=+